MKKKRKRKRKSDSKTLSALILEALALFFLILFFRAPIKEGKGFRLLSLLLSLSLFSSNGVRDVAGRWFEESERRQRRERDWRGIRMEKRQRGRRGRKRSRERLQDAFLGSYSFPFRGFKPSPDRTEGFRLNLTCAFVEEESRRRTGHPASTGHSLLPGVSQDKPDLAKRNGKRALISNEKAFPSPSFAPLRITMIRQFGTGSKNSKACLI